MKSEPEYFSNQVVDARRWFLTLPRPKDSGLVTVSVGSERCLPDYIIERETFEFEAIEFVAEGEGELILNDVHHPLKPGSVFSYRSGVSHCIRNTSKNPMLKYFLDCGGALARKRFDKCTAGGGRVVHVGSVAEIMDLFELLIVNAMSETQWSEEICAALTEALLLKISEKTIKSGVADSRAWATYERIRRHMQKHYLHIKSMAEVASELGIDPAYLSRVFRRFHQTSPYRYLVRLKMSHAASLLLRPDSLVKDIAYEMDFPDPFHFSKSFKSVYGISPEQFLRRGKHRNLKKLAN